MDKIRAHIIVEGRVQGVFYRDSTREQARRKGVTGWVKNLYDGRVEAVLEGEREAVEQVIVFMKRGPEFARVLGCEVSYQGFAGEFECFSISRSE